MNGITQPGAPTAVEEKALEFSRVSLALCSPVSPASLPSHARCVLGVFGMRGAPVRTQNRKSSKLGRPCRPEHGSCGSAGSDATPSQSASLTPGPRYGARSTLNPSRRLSRDGVNFCLFAGHCIIRLLIARFNETSLLHANPLKLLFLLRASTLSLVGLGILSLQAKRTAVGYIATRWFLPLLQAPFGPCEIRLSDRSARMADMVSMSLRWCQAPWPGIPIHEAR